MSTNKTPNYKLHAWELQDEFHVGEINENFAALDTALKAEAKAAAQALAALDADAIRLVCGTYSGNSAKDGQAINVGMQPRAVIVAAWNGFYGGTTNASCMTIRGTTTAGKELSITETGFLVKSVSIAVNTAGTTFFYLAFC